MNKRVIVVCGLLVLSFFCFQIFSTNMVQALPGPPMIVYGVINETGSGKNIPVGISVDAYVIDAINGNEWFNFTTGLNVTLDLAGYGFLYAGEEFRINDTDPPVRQGNDVYFYINGEEVHNYSFSAGTTERNYTLTDISEILYVNSSDPGTAGSSYFVNVTATDLFDTASEMGVKINWSHGALSGNTSLSPTGGDWFNGTFTLDNSTTNLTYMVWVNDSAGNLNSSGPYTITVNDAVGPVSSVDSISEYWHNVSDNPLNITATSSGSSGLKNVTLYYYHSTDNSSFDGPFLFSVNTSPWVGVSWSFSFSNASGYYRFYSVATDNLSTSESVPVTNDTICGYDNSEPSSTITRPANNADLDSLSNITGTASDSTSGVDYVNITIYNSTNGKYWNGTGWQENVSWLNTNGTTAWYNDSGLPTWVNGKDYIINSTAVDVAGNIESSPDSNTFTYDTSNNNGNPGSGSPSGGGYVPSGDFTDPSKPTNVTCISIVVDTTPSFTWTAATDNQEVAGYHVKIDDGTETSIGDVLQWTSGILSDGVYKFYVRAEDGSGNLGPYGNCTFTIDTTDITLMMPVADVGGPYTNILTNQTVLFDGSSSNDPDGSIVNYSWVYDDGEVGYGSSVSYVYDESGEYNVTLTVTDDDGLSDSDTINIIVFSDMDGDGWSDEMEESYGVDPDDPLDQPVDTDGDGIPDEDSSDGSFTGDTDDDNDGVDDGVEKEFGSNPKDGSDVSSLNIEDQTYYLIDSDDDGIYDGLYVDNETESLIVEKDGVYLLDIDGDGKYDYLYDAILGETSEYVEQEQSDDEIPWLFVIIGIIASAIIAFLVLLKLGYIIIER